MDDPPAPTKGRRDQRWWDERYRSRQTGWDKPTHAFQVEKALQEIKLPGRHVLDLGCGRGRNSRFLASQGLSVVGVDISAVAVADAQASKGDLDCSFHCLDVLEDPIPSAPFHAVFDYGCLHVFDDDKDRSTLARVVASVLHPRGLWYILAGSTDGPPRQMGPPRISALALVRAVEPCFEILELRRGILTPGEQPARLTWECLLQKR